MRIALISDIHGNLLALEAVLTELQNENIDQFICLGDVALFGPQPREVLARLRGLAGTMVLGNTDAWALGPGPSEMRDEDSLRFFDVESWGAQQLSPTDLEYMSSFRPVVEVHLDKETNLLCYHGSPRAIEDLILATTADEELEAMLSGHQADVMAGGHSHAQMLRRFGATTLINPGSTGLPFVADLLTGRSRNPSWAEYAVVSKQASSLTIDLRRTLYDTTELVRTALASGMPHAEWWIKGWTEE
jgi:putative phosphoesterase